MKKDHWILEVIFTTRQNSRFRQLVIFRCDEDYFCHGESAFEAWKSDYMEFHKGENIVDVEYFDRHEVVTFDPQDVK